MRAFLWLVFTIVLVFGNPTNLNDKQYPTFRMNRSIMTVMTQVESKMATQSSYEDVSSIINQFEQDLYADQSNQDKLFQSQSKECLDEQSYRKDELQAAQEVIAKSKEQLANCVESKSKSDQELDNVNKQIQLSSSYLQHVKQDHEKYITNYQKVLSAHISNTHTVDRALEILEQIWNGEASFIQLSVHTNEMLRQSIAMNRINKLSPVLSALAQLSSSKLQPSDESLLKQVVELLRQYRDATENEIFNIQEDEQKNKTSFQENSENIEEFLRGQKELAESLNEQIKNLSNCIVTQQTILDLGIDKQTRNQGLLDAAIKMCDSFEKEKKSAQELRNQQLQLLNVIRNKVTRRYGGELNSSNTPSNFMQLGNTVQGQKDEKISRGLNLQGNNRSM